MGHYSLTDRFKERSTAVGALIAVVGGVLPTLVPPEQLSTWITAANALIGLALALMPDSGGARDAQAIVKALEADPRLAEAVRLAQGKAPHSHG